MPMLTTGDSSTTRGRIFASRTDVCVVEGKFLPTTIQNFTTFWNNIFARFLTYHLQTWRVFSLILRRSFQQCQRILERTHARYDRPNPPTLPPNFILSNSTFSFKMRKKYIVQLEPTSMQSIIRNHVFYD